MRSIVQLDQGLPEVLYPLVDLKRRRLPSDLHHLEHLSDLDHLGDLCPLAVLDLLEDLFKNFALYEESRKDKKMKK